MNEPNTGVIKHIFVVANTSRGQVKPFLLTREQQRNIVEFLLNRHGSGIPVTHESISGLGVAASQSDRKVA
jgi:hypothetical protein